MMAGLLGLQALTLTGSLVGGHLARRRRKELEVLNRKLRDVLLELRRKQEEQETAIVCEASPEEAMVSYRKALEASMTQPAAAHPVEAYGVEGMSLATARRKLSKLLYDARDAIAADNYSVALATCDEGIELSREMGDPRAERAVLRVQARALKLVREYNSAVTALERALAISRELNEFSGDVDTLGSLADVYVELGDLERASELYDQVIGAIQVEDTSMAVSSTWDC